MARIVYEDSDIVAVWQDGSSDFLLVTFGDRLEIASGTRFYAENVVRKSGITCLGIMAREPNWYPVAAMSRLAVAVQALLKDFQIRIGYGGSMGGYGAIKHSARLGLTHTIAMCPQWSIDSAECDGWNPGYQNFFRPYMANHGIVRTDVSGRVFLFHDPRDPTDDGHAQSILHAVPDAEVMPMWHLGHHVTPALAGTLNLTEIISAVAADDVCRLRGLASRLRRASGERAHKVLTAAARKHPHQAVRALSHAKSGWLSRFGAPTEYLLPILDYMLTVGATKEAQVVIDTITDRYPVGLDVAEMLMTRHELRRRNVSTSHRLRTFHGTWMVYDTVEGRVRHVSSERLLEAGDDLLPVQVAVIASNAEISHEEKRVDFFVDLYGYRYDLDVRDDGYCRPRPGHQIGQSARYGRWRIEPQPLGGIGSDRVAFRGQAGYLCATYQSWIATNRSAADHWERFSIV